MAFFNEQEIRAKARAYKSSTSLRATKSFGELTREVSPEVPLGTPFDIFLSHCLKDAELILGLARALIEMGHTVYVDWMVDPSLDRNKVNKGTADLLRKRMQDCKCMFYGATEAAESSRWMPWEVGYFDAKKNKVAILPIKSSHDTSNEYAGQEYLSLYYYVSVTPSAAGSFLLVHESKRKWVLFSQWLKGELPKEH